MHTPAPKTGGTFQNVFYHSLRILIGAAFIWASWDKVFDPTGFAAIVENYQLLPAPLVNPTALILPWIELVCGVLMVTGVWVRSSSLILGMLLVVFILALTINAYRGIDVNCGCFSVDAAHSGGLYQLIVRDVIMLSGVIWVGYYRVKTLTVS